MTIRFLLWLVVASALGMGCSGRATGSTSDGGGGSDDGGVVFSTPLVVAGSEQDGEGLQGGTHQLLWTGTQFAILYFENLGGHIFIRVRFVDADGTTVSEAFPVTMDYFEIEDSPESGKMVWVNGELRIFWTTWRQTIMMRRMGADGQLLSEPTPTVQDVGVHAYLETVIPHADGFALLWMDDQLQEYAYLPSFVRIDSTGTELFPPALMVTDQERIDTVGGMVVHNDQFSMVWSLRSIANPDLVLLTSFDQDGVLAGPPQEIYSSHHAILSFYGTPVVSWLDGALAAIWKYDGGVVLVDTTDTTGGDGHLVLEPDEVTDRPIIAVSESGAEDTIAVLYGSGEYTDTNPLSTELRFATVDPQDWNVTRRAHLNAQTQMTNSCLEDSDIVSAGAGFGVTWVRGCEPGRTLYFTKVSE